MASKHKQQPDIVLYCIDPQRVEMGNSDRDSTFGRFQKD